MLVDIGRYEIKKLCENVILAAEHHRCETFKEWHDNLKEEQEEYAALPWFRKLFSKKPEYFFEFPDYIEQYEQLNDEDKFARAFLLYLDRVVTEKHSFQIDVLDLASLEEAIGFDVECDLEKGTVNVYNHIDD